MVVNLQCYIYDVYNLAYSLMVSLAVNVAFFTFAAKAKGIKLQIKNITYKVQPVTEGQVFQKITVQV